MEDIMQKYWKYHKAIKTIGSYPLYHELLLKDIGEETDIKKTVQACYYEMKRDGIDISVIDYLCRVATMFLIHSTSGKHKDILLKYETQKEEVKLFLRYFMKAPYFYLPKLDKKVFQEIAVFWYEIFDYERTNYNK